MRGKIGRGKNISIAKAALIYFYEDMDTSWEGRFLDYGDLKMAHTIIDIAGAQHAGPATSVQVTACLSSSNLWDKEMMYGFYKGIGNGNCNAYIPSEKGKKYYEEHLKDKHKIIYRKRD